MARLAFLVLALTFFSHAEEIQVQKMTTSGRLCRNEDVLLLQNGNAISLLFNQFGINLAQGKKRYSQAEACFISMEIKLPDNRCVTEIDQLFNGGVIKSARSRGSLFIAYNLHTLAGQRLKQWKYNDPILPEDADSVFSISLQRRARHSTCIKGKIRYNALLIMEGQRWTLDHDHFLSQLDSNDAELFLRLH